MSHHASKKDRELQAIQDMLFSKGDRPGPTGMFPDGKVTEHDEGK